ncbi:MAG: molybdopterin molybdenumtransferase MoeA [Desulfotalea sp.]|nr:MAG: molybdopterin molybdenumtransferase MoeA [Desulfotalea sp.]
MISLTQAHRDIVSLQPLEAVVISLDKALGLVCSEDVYARSSCPSVDSSVKDGFAVVADDIDCATETCPVELSVVGALMAGDGDDSLQVTKGNAVRIMTGAPVPDGATSVVASEFTEQRGSRVVVRADARVGRNILLKGSDIKRGQLLLVKGTLLRPALLGLLAAAGIGSLACHRLPRVAIAATGSELVWPGEEVTPGKVAASNMVTAQAELKRLGIDASVHIVRDNLDGLEAQFKELVENVDVLITCGGVLDGDKDLTMKAMERLGMEKIFHRVRIGPGKGACLGRLGATVVFNLPGGPPSNHVALILLALPGCRRLMGFGNCLPVQRSVVVQEELSGQHGWTQLVYSRVRFEKDLAVAVPLYKLGRLEAMGAANALVLLPEDCKVLKAGEHATAWILDSSDAL